MIDFFDISEFFQLDDAIETVCAAGFRSGVVYLQGNLGAGKTAFVARWLASLGWHEVVCSPSYSIVNEYDIADFGTVIHADLYRISEPDELLYLDVGEWGLRSRLCFIEWPDKGGDWLPLPDAIAELTFNGKQRLLRWQRMSGG